MVEPDISEYVLWDGFQEVPGETTIYCLDCLTQFESFEEHNSERKHRCAAAVIRRRPDSMLRTKEQLDRMRQATP